MENITVYDGRSGVIQVNAKLVIKNFLEVIRSGFKPGKSFETMPFKLGDSPMILEVFPNGYDDDNKGYVSILLVNTGEADLSVKCKFITDVATEEFDYRNLEDGQHLGFFRFFTHAECAEAYKDKDFVVTAKVEIPGEPVKIVGIESVPAQTEKLNIF